MLTLGSATFTYDNNGNVITKTVGSAITTYSWDYDNMLTKVKIGGCRTCHAYDGLGNRISKTNESSVETRYVVEPRSSSVLEETDDTGTVTAYYVYGLGLISKITPSDEAYFYHYDGLGSIVAMTDSSGNVVNKYAYDAYGKIVNQSETVSNPFKYVGLFGVMDEGNGLLYMRARYYDTGMRRFLSKDPIGFAGGDLNLYAYVGNNPVNWVDPWGLIQVSPYTYVGWLGTGLMTVGGGIGLTQGIPVQYRLIGGGMFIVGTALYWYDIYRGSNDAAKATEEVIKPILNDMNELNRELNRCDK